MTFPRSYNLKSFERSRKKNSNGWAALVQFQLTSDLWLLRIETWKKWWQIANFGAICITDSEFSRS